MKILDIMCLDVSWLW